jgi:hypothetical protein
MLVINRIPDAFDLFATNGLSASHTFQSPECPQIPAGSELRTVGAFENRQFDDGNSIVTLLNAERLRGYDMQSISAQVKNRL